jgi:hypothetical protein
MMPAKYRDGIRAAYKGELIGEALYRELAHRSAQLDHQAKLHAIADVEQLTNSRLKSIAVRLDINLIEADWRPEVERRADELGCLSWSEFIRQALRDWPAYISEFETLQALAPPSDAKSIQLLVDHEVALVKFVRVEHEAPGSSDSIRVLKEFLGAA